MADTSPQKPSWLADLLGKDATSEQTHPLPPLTEGVGQDWASSVTVGKGTLSDDPMSGSIMKLLDQNGFRQKIESGIQNGHAFTIIHNAPSTEFLMIEQWMENGEPRKNYQAFSIKSAEPKPAAPVPQEIPPPHPILVILRGLETELDSLLAQTKRLA